MTPLQEAAQVLHELRGRFRDLAQLQADYQYEHQGSRSKRVADANSRQRAYRHAEKLTAAALTKLSRIRP